MIETCSGYMSGIDIFCEIHMEIVISGSVTEMTWTVMSHVSERSLSGVAFVASVMRMASLGMV